jgi:hypothetical protein
LTPVTPESFAIWKKTRVDKKVAESEAKEKAKAAARAAGKISGMSGKDLFDYSADMLQDEDEVRALFQLAIIFGRLLTFNDAAARTTRTNGIFRGTSLPEIRTPDRKMMTKVTPTMIAGATTVVTKRMDEALQDRPGPTRVKPWRMALQR